MPLVPLSPANHARAKVRPLTSLSFAAKTAAVPLYISDVAPMCHELPVVFVGNEETVALAAMTGLQSDVNLMLDPLGRWLGAHLPGVWRSIPFRFGRVEGENTNLVLCVDDTTQQINETEGVPLFNEDGTPSTLVEAAKTLLVQFENEAAALRAICAEVKRLGLLVPWALDVTQADGGKRTLSGVYRVEESKIRDIPANDLARLRDLGGLAVIYAHLLSLSRINTLQRLAQREAERTQQRNVARSGTVDLDRAFGIVEDDPFIF